MPDSPFPKIDIPTNLPVPDGDEVITKGADAGKTVQQLHNEVFNPKISDEEYFRQRYTALIVDLLPDLKGPGFHTES
jgi:hypothetical protein